MPDESDLPPQPVTHVRLEFSHFLLFPLEVLCEWENKKNNIAKKKETEIPSVIVERDGKVITTEKSLRPEILFPFRSYKHL